MNKKTSRVLPPSVQVYFTRSDKKLYERVRELARKHNVSDSAMVVLAVRKGLSIASKRLEGLLSDVDEKEISSSK